MEQTKDKTVVDLYARRFNTKPAYIVKAPGRINLIGEHTDYSEGFVLPAAIDRHMTVAFSPRTDRKICVYSLDFDEFYELDLEKLERNQNGWIDYVQGMAWAMLNSGYQISGWQGVISGTIPIGAGLSSSAALEVAIGKTFCLASQLDINPQTLAVISRKAETDWVGVNVGIMDQLISAAGKEQHALLLDCRSLEFEYVPIPGQLSFVVLDTMTRRELTHSEYNTRHDEVQKASEILGLTHLRDATPTLLQENRSKFSSVLYRRAQHVVNENERVLEFAKAMRNNDLSSMGNLVNESHFSLRDDFKVSSSELNLIVELAQKHPDCPGARMMGAGFGGCALALLENSHVSSFGEEISRKYHTETGLEPHIFKVSIANGVYSNSLVTVSNQVK